MKLAERIFKRTDYYITSPFGERINPATHKKSFHNGCDYGTHLNNWNQYALEDGEVYEIRTGKKDKDGSGLGNYVKVRYPRIGIQCTHGHLKQVFVKKGQQVNHDTVLGTTGMTGTATGIHLHLGLQKIGSSVWTDPEKYDYEVKNMFKIGDVVEALEDVKLYTTVEQKESKYTIKKGEIGLVKLTYNNTFICLADVETKVYFPSGWTKELNKFKLYEPDYKELYEEELEKNKILQDKINKAIRDLE